MKTCSKCHQAVADDPYRSAAVTVAPTWSYIKAPKRLSPTVNKVLTRVGAMMLGLSSIVIVLVGIWLVTKGASAVGHIVCDEWFGWDLVTGYLPATKPTVEWLMGMLIFAMLVASPWVGNRMMNWKPKR